MAVNINGTALKNLNVNGSKMKQLNVNGTKFWSSEAQFYPGTTPTRPTNYGSGSYTGTSSNWSFWIGNGTNVNSVVSYIPVNLTGINTLVITGSSSGSLAGWYLVNQSQKNTHAGQYGALTYPYYVFYSPNTSAYTQKGTSFPASINVSSYSGTYYLFLGGYTNSNGDQSASITSVIGRE